MNIPMKLAVCGGRNYADRDFVFKALDYAHAHRRITLLVHGDYGDTDHAGRDWAIARGVPHKPFPADWNGLGRAAGPIRNQQMVDFGIDGCAAFPGGAGTADMKARCKAAKVSVWEPELTRAAMDAVKEPR